VYLMNDPHKMRSLGEHDELPFGGSFKCMDEPNPKHVSSLSCIVCYVFCGILDHSIYLMLEGFYL
jgi:hypothetical protein